ncbi:hypothetical protein HPULCUR_012169 [Helicostylum pulchrum]|uniref:Uncharacterized protein n=1 Tax=Helicostylum pulchrum TaxID=562976 RepID=A0ABP9YID7_9FUNG
MIKEWRSVGGLTSSLKYFLNTRILQLIRQGYAAFRPDCLIIIYYDGVEVGAVETKPLNTCKEPIEACNAVPAEILYNFACRSKRQIIQCYNETIF